MEGRVLVARASTKISEEILQWAGTQKVLAGKVSGMEILGDLLIYPCKMLIHVLYLCYNCKWHPRKQLQVQTFFSSAPHDKSYNKYFQLDKYFQQKLATICIGAIPPSFSSNF